MNAAVWRCIALALAALLVVAGGGIVYARSAGDQAGFERATTERAASDAVAVFARVRDNAVESARQVNINQTITRTKNEEVAPVVQRIYIDRVRVGAGTCGPAGTADAKGASGSDGADSSGRLVRDDVERDTRALTEAVEQDLATGRACQAFVRENGMAD